MEPFNRVEMRGRVGSHTITLRDDGHWEGWFDLHVATKNMHGVYQPMVFDCHVAEDGKKVKDLGASIGGKIVRITGRLVQYFGSKSDEFKGATVSRRRKAVYVDLTDLDYIEFGNEYGYYRKAFARELKRTNEAFLVAFVNRFDLFDISPREKDAPTDELSPEDLARALEMLGIARTIKAYPYRKEIAAFKTANRQEDCR